MISLRDRLQTPLPDCNEEGRDMKHRSKKISMNPERVIDWPGFAEEVRAFPLDTATRHQPFEPASIARAVALGAILPEAMFAHFFARNVLELVVDCFPAQTPTCYSMLPLSLRSPADLQIGAGTQLLVGQGKSHSENWQGCDSLVAIYECSRQRNAAPWHRQAARAIRQLYCYMVQTGKQFAFLTTYNYTWFFQRNPQNYRELWISPRILITDADPSVAQCIYYLLHQPGNAPPPMNFEHEFYETSDGEDRDQRRSDSGRRASKRHSSAGDSGSDTKRVTRSCNASVHGKLDDLSTHVESAIPGSSASNSLVHGSLRSCIKCTLWFPLYANEVADYFAELQSLEELHDKSIPRPLHCGVWQGQAAIVFEGRWNTVERPDKLTPADKVAVLDAYRPVQRMQMRFDDMKSEYIIMDASTEKYMFLPEDIYLSSTKKESTAQADQLRRLLYGSP